LGRSKNRLSRREFLQLGAGAVGGVLLSACGGKRREQAAPASAPTSRPPSTAATSPPATIAPGTFADTVFTGGKVVTMDKADLITQAVAVKDGRILEVGPDELIRTVIGPQTAVTELKGRTLTPGLVDTHNHLNVVGLIGTAYVNINPPAVRTLEDLQATMSERIAQTPKGKWVVGQGFITFGGRFPDKTDLDPISPDHPVMLINQGGHMGTVNSYALKLAGVTAKTPNPKYGLFLRDASGEPTGGLMNHSAMDVFRILWGTDVITPDIWTTASIAPQEFFGACGVTTFGDVNVRGLDRLAAYFDVARQGKMISRAYLLNTIEYYPELAGRDDAVKAMVYNDEYMHFAGYKFLVDGALAGMYTHEPHNGYVWNMATWDPRALNDAVKTVHNLGYQCSFHTVGDAAVDMALDAIEAAMKANPRPDPRHRIEHAVLNTNDAIKRTADLGVIVSTQTQGIYAMGDYVVTTAGNERAQRMMPCRSWLEAGVPMCLSTDAPTLPFWTPQTVLAGAISRVTASNKVIGPDQILTFHEALRAMTITGAYALFEENVKGSLEPGKMADLMIWKDDPYGMDWQALYQAKVDLTMVGGKVIHQA